MTVYMKGYAVSDTKQKTFVGSFLFLNAILKLNLASALAPRSPNELFHQGQATGTF